MPFAWNEKKNRVRREKINEASNTKDGEWEAYAG